MTSTRTTPSARLPPSPLTGVKRHALARVDEIRELRLGTFLRAVANDGPEEFMGLLEAIALARARRWILVGVLAAVPSALVVWQIILLRQQNVRIEEQNILLKAQNDLIGVQVQDLRSQRDLERVGSVSPLQGTLLELVFHCTGPLDPTRSLTPSERAAWANKAHVLLKAQENNRLLLGDRGALQCWIDAANRATFLESRQEQLPMSDAAFRAEVSAVLKCVFNVYSRLFPGVPAAGSADERPPEQR